MAGGLLREATWLAAERWQVPRDVPTGASNITPVWLTAILQRDFPRARVQSLCHLGAHAGTTDRARIGVTYDHRGTGAAPPSSVFVKTAPLDAKTRLFVNLMRLGSTEVRFYQEIAVGVPVERPRVFHAQVHGRAQRFVLVFEDLVERSARFTDVAADTTLDEARLVMRELGRLHAHFWDSPRLRSDLAWLKSRDHNSNTRIERLLCARAVPLALKRFAELVPLELRVAAPRIMAARDSLEDAWARGPLTLIHGDAHVGNLYFLPSTVGFLDWQVVQRGQGMRDVSYFLINSLPTETRQTHQRDLIGLYLVTLRDHGIAVPDFEAAWEQYRLHAIYAWIATIVTAAAATLQVEKIVRAALARSSAAVMELDALGALDALRTGAG